MTQHDLAQPLAHDAYSGPPRHTGRRTGRQAGRLAGRRAGRRAGRLAGRRADRRPMAYAVVAAVVLVAVFGVYPLLDNGGDSPVVQAVDNAVDRASAGSRSGSTGVAGGDVPGGQATLDDDLPAITGLDPALAAAVRQAADDAAADGIDLWITSGWRSPAFQQYLLDEAVKEYGSLEEARRWVNTPEKSTHVGGNAVDIGPTEADYWMIQHGAEYGLCQVYANEIWHFELLTEPGGTCPPLVEDSSAD